MCEADTTDHVADSAIDPDGAPGRAGGKLTAADLRPRTTLVQDILRLLIKVGVIVVVAGALVTFVFGLWRCDTGDMDPSVRDGDLVLYYRLDRDYEQDDVLLMDVDGKVSVSRVIGVAGDVIDMTDDGVTVNGGAPVGIDTYGQRTYAVSADVTFPLTVGQGQVFVLGDARESAVDSRSLGCVDVSDTSGTVVGILRRRGI
ncbi:MAG: signal peptidase I [Atopobiaceae bacterium]|jgi:signal peptidase I|nr:signal peptidase I [Atopobiaceae bacterium]